MHWNNRERLIVHVGLPKAGSSTLQLGLLPALSNRGYINFDESHRQYMQELVTNLYGVHPVDKHPSLEISFDSNNCDVSVISFEGLSNIGSDWDPFNWELSPKLVKDYLPECSEILICLRAPKSYLISSYCHSIRQGEFHTNIDNFLLDSQRYKIARTYMGQLASKRFFDVDNFNYEKLIMTWRKYFNKVTVVPLQTILSPKMREVFEINFTEDDISNIIDKQIKHYNKRITKFAMEMTLCRNILLRTWETQAESCSQRWIHDLSLKLEKYPTDQLSIEEAKMKIKPFLDNIKVNKNGQYALFCKEDQKDFVKLLPQDIYVILKKDWNQLLGSFVYPEKIWGEERWKPEHDFYEGRHKEANEALYRCLLEKEILVYRN